jgi:hypothetical protein
LTQRSLEGIEISKLEELSRRASCPPFAFLPGRSSQGVIT